MVSLGGGRKGIGLDVRRPKKKHDDKQHITNTKLNGINRECDQTHARALLKDYVIGVAGGGIPNLQGGSGKSVSGHRPGLSPYSTSWLSIGRGLP